MSLFLFNNQATATDYMRKIILASGSPRRIKFLKELNLRFQVQPSQIDEEEILSEHGNLPPERIAEKLARAKALDVQRQNPDALVIGADTLVVVDQEILGKPKTIPEAIEMLRKLSGTTHQVITGLCVLSQNRQELAHESTAVTFKPLKDSEIYNYVETGEPMDAAGAYKIQERADRFVTSVIGDYNNVVGLPVDLLKSLLKKFSD